LKEVIVNELLAAAEALTVPLRMGRGLDEEALARVEDALERAAIAWRGDPMIPKRAASVLVELASSVETSSYLYDVSQADLIRQHAAHLGDLVARCFSD
jgi:hypothetical protein